MDVWWNTHFSAKDLEASNWNNPFWSGMFEVSFRWLYIYIYTFFLYLSLRCWDGWRFPPSSFPPGTEQGISTRAFASGSSPGNSKKFVTAQQLDVKGWRFFLDGPPKIGLIKLVDGRVGGPIFWRSKNLWSIGFLIYILEGRDWWSDWDGCISVLNELKSPASIGSQGKFCGHVQEFYIEELEYESSRNMYAHPYIHAHVHTFIHSHMHTYNTYIRTYIHTSTSFNLRITSIYIHCLFHDLNVTFMATGFVFFPCRRQKTRRLSLLPFQ